MMATLTCAEPADTAANSKRQKRSIVMVLLLNLSVGFVNRLPSVVRDCQAGLSGENAQNLILAHDHVFFTFNLDVGSRILAEQDAVAGLHIQRATFAILQQFSVADSNHFTLLRLFLRGVQDDDAANPLFTLLNAANQNTVVQGTDIHSF